MKKELVKGFTMVAFVVVLALAAAAASATAQSSGKVSADVPFEFSVGYKTMPAGEYSVQTVSSSGNSLLIQSRDGKTSALRLSDATSRIKNKSHALLVFHRYGERYFLAEVWNGADITGRQLLQSLEERAIERELQNIAATSDEGRITYEIVEVVAVLR